MGIGSTLYQPAPIVGNKVQNGQVDPALFGAPVQYEQGQVGQWEWPKLPDLSNLGEQLLEPVKWILICVVGIGLAFIGVKLFLK